MIGSLLFAFVGATLLVPAGGDLIATALLWCGFTLGRHVDSLRAAYNAYRLTWRG
jgi:hypothetical protein